MRNLFALIIALLGSGVTQAASAGPFEDSVAVYNRGDKATAVTILLPLAKSGDPKAQNQLGDFFYDGVDPNDARALGNCRRSNQCIMQDFGEAAKWYRLAGEQGYSPALMNLGALYMTGQGVLDYREAAKWFRLAAVKGVPEAQFWLGDLDWKLGDIIHGHVWVNIARAAGFDAAIPETFQMESEMTPQQILQAQDLALRCQQSSYQDCG